MADIDNAADAGAKRTQQQRHKPDAGHRNARTARRNIIPADGLHVTSEPCAADDDGGKADDPKRNQKQQRQRTHHRIGEGIEVEIEGGDRADAPVMM